MLRDLLFSASFVLIPVQCQKIMDEPSRTSEAALTKLLTELFDPDSLRRFIRSWDVLAVVYEELPGLVASPTDVADGAVRLFQRHGLIGQELFIALGRERPRRRQSIAMVASEFGCALPEPRTAKSPTPVLERYRRSIGLLHISDECGATAWLAAQDRAITHGAIGPHVSPGQRMVLAFPGRCVNARLHARHDNDDCAILALEPPLVDRPALPIADQISGRTHGCAIGYGRARAGWTVPIEGILVLPGTGALTLQSDELAVHLTQPRHCLLGTPIFVDGHVVGHLSGIFEHPSQPGRSLSGLVRACPSSHIIERLRNTSDRAPVVVGPGRPTATRTGARDGFVLDTLVSCGVPDREWANELVQRLETQGVHALLAEPERPEAIRDGVVARALSRCRSAVVVMSRHWLDSRRCSATGALLLERLNDDPEFRLVVARRDDTPIPEPWASRHGQDFQAGRHPSGRALDALVHALQWQELPSPSTPAGIVGYARTNAIDTMEMELWAAAQVGSSEVMKLWRRWYEAGALSLAPSLRAAEYLIAQARADLALQVLAQIQGGVRGEQLRALAHARTDNDDVAIQILERLRQRVALDSETLGLLAGRYKQRWSDTQELLWLQKAFDLYSEAFRRFGDSYPGINAAALALYLGRTRHSATLAREVLEMLQHLPERSLDHWQLATYAEAHHLLEQMEQARYWYGEALKRGPVFHSDVAVMRRQARRNADYLGQSRHVFDDLLVVPRVVAFVGHMEDLPDRPIPRFPTSKVPHVRSAIRNNLRKLKAGFGYSSLARGGDILFVEEMLRRRGHVKALLPFPPGAFEVSSVGPRWRDRFHRLLANQRVETQVMDDRRPADEDLPDAFDACTRNTFHQAIQRAQALGDPPVLLAVWDGSPGDGRGGTADAIAFWLHEGHPLKVLDINHL